MSGGGSKPRGGKMGTSIRATSVSGEAVAMAEKELYEMVDSLNKIRNKISDAVQRCQASEKAVARLEMELAKCKKEVIIFVDCWSFIYKQSNNSLPNNLHFEQIESFTSQHSYLEKQHDSLKAASQPKKDELDRLEELKNIISAEEKEIDKIVQGSKKLKEKVSAQLISSLSFLVAASCFRCLVPWVYYGFTANSL